MMISVLVLGVLFFLSFYLVGSLFLNPNLGKQVGFLQHTLRFWVGLLLVVSAYAIIKTAFVTIFILVPVVLFLFRKSFVEVSEVKPMPGFKFCLYAVGTYVFLFFLQVNFALDVLNHPFAYVSYIHPDDGERYIYSTILSLVHYGGAETISPESVLKGVSGVSLYHFAEFWLGSLFKTVYNVKSDIALFYFIFPVFKTFAVLSVFSIFSDLLKSKKMFLVILFILFCFAVLGFRYVLLPVYKDDLRNIVIIPILILVCKLIYIKKLDASLALLMIASVENILFMPAVFILLAVFFRESKPSMLIKAFSFLAIYMLFFLFFKESVQDKYFTLGVGEAVKYAISNFGGNSKFIVLGFLYFPIRILLSYFLFVNFENIKSKLLVLNLSYWLFISFIAYNLVFTLIANLSIDASQFRTIAFMMARVSFIFLLYELLKRNKVITCVIIVLLMSDDSHLFAKPSMESSYDVVLESKLEAIGKGKQLKGFFVNEEARLPNQFYIYHFPTHATEYARANDYRMYLFNYDITSVRKSIQNLDPTYQPIFNKAIQPLFPLNINIWENIRKHDISIVWISKSSKYLEFFRGKKPLHELEDYYVYHVE